MGKLSREALAHYLDTAFHSKAAEAGEAVWEVIGDDIEEMTVEMNPDTETLKNILGQTKTNDNGYEPTMDADPFYADPEKKLYPKLRDIALKRLKGDECKTLMLEVLVEDTSAENHLAFVQEVIVKPNSYGGGTEGVNIPFTVSEDGERVEGYVSNESMKQGKISFTSGVMPASLKNGSPVAVAKSGKALTD